MAKGLLSAVEVKAARTRGLYHDGGGLYFQVTDKGSRSWVYRFKLRNRTRYMGLGAFPAVSLKEARDKHVEAQRLARAGVDPIIARGAQRQIAASARSVQATCEAYVEAQRARWKVARNVVQIKQRLRDFVYTVIGHLAIADISLAEAKQVLVPIWTTKHPTANVVRRYMEEVVNYAIHEGLRSDESNPFEMKRLKYSLPVGVHKTKNFPALPYEQAPAFLPELRKQGGVKAKALEFIMLTATRIGDITGGGKDHSVPMLWSHVDLPGALWVIPDTKMSKPHTVPLSEPALRLLGEMQAYRDLSSDFVFPGRWAGTSLSPVTVRQLLRKMGYGGLATPHGMRSCFRTFASETTPVEKDVVESCLAHAQGELDAAYHRGSYLAKRRALMALWASYLEGETVSLGGSVVALRA
jgi:integrase